MTRFARAEGSKSSNKREYEEATPWEAMKNDMMKQKKKKIKNIKSENKLKLPSQTDSSLKNQCNEPLKNNDGQIVESDKNVKNKKVSFEELKKNWIIEDGKRYKIFKDGTKKPWFDLPYEENDVMTRYKNFFIKREDINELLEYKLSLEDQNLNSKEITKKLLHKERKLHNKLKLELLRKEIGEKEKQKPPKKKPKISVESTQKEENKTKIKSQFEYEENEVMTNFDGYWILRENLSFLQNVAEMKLQRIIDSRSDGNKDKKLTPEEELQYRRLMKKEKRREFYLLQNYLQSTAKKLSYSANKNRDKIHRQNQNNNNNLVKFDGYYITKEGAERLKNLRETMLAKGCTEEEIMNVMKTERRKEEKVLKRENNLFCYQCRQPGHMVSFCPENENTNNKNTFVSCYKCGSTQHTAKNCKSRNKSGSSFPLATCFICKEVGHISRECPDNPKGLYPYGGCCKICGSVEHLKKDCPDIQGKKTEENMTASLLRRGEEVEELEEDFKIMSTSQCQKRKKPKIVKF